MKQHHDIIESSETILEVRESGRFLNGISEAQLELQYNRSSERAETQRKEIDDIEDDLISMNIELIRNVRTVIRHSGPRNHDDHEWLNRLGESERAKYDTSISIPPSPQSQKTRTSRPKCTLISCPQRNPTMPSTKKLQNNNPGFCLRRRNHLTILRNPCGPVSFY